MTMLGSSDAMDDFTDYPDVEEDPVHCATVKEALSILQTAIFCQEEKLGPTLCTGVYDANTS
jgi:hypothetical protein